MLAGIILAAGKGTRFKSRRPKVLHPILGTPMVWYICKALRGMVDKLFMVIGYGAEYVERACKGMVDQFVFQKDQLGTGHALMCALPEILSCKIDKCVVVNGDMPLVTKELFDLFIGVCLEKELDLGLVTTHLEDPYGYGRILRDDKGFVKFIVEEKDIKDSHTKQIKEVNTGIYFLNLLKLKDLLSLISNDNAQKEYYLTDIVELAYKKGLKVDGIISKDKDCVLGVNNPKDLNLCESILQNKINDFFMSKGVILRNKNLVKIGPEVNIDSGVDISGPCEIYGESSIGSGCVVESNVVIRNCKVGKDCLIRSFSYLEDADVGDGCQIGPFSRIRPGTLLEEDVRIGNFVEVKKSYLKRGVKANHLSYIGDASVGEESNIGAGTITCNYDGYKKHNTVIGKKAFIGSNTALVAPVKVGNFCVIGAGSTITKDVPDEMLVVARAKQKVVRYKKLRKRE